MTKALKKLKSSKKVREVKKKVKVRELEEEEELDEEMEEQEVAFVPSSLPRRLTSLLKPNVRTIEEIPDLDIPLSPISSEGEPVRYEKPSASGETKISYESAKSGDLKKYTGRDKYHTAEAATAEERLSSDRKETRSYAEANPFSERTNYQDRAFRTDEEKEKDKEEKRKRELM